MMRTGELSGEVWRGSVEAGANPMDLAEPDLNATRGHASMNADGKPHLPGNQPAMGAALGQ